MRERLGGGEAGLNDGTAQNVGWQMAKPVSRGIGRADDLFFFRRWMPILDERFSSLSNHELPPAPRVINLFVIVFVGANCVLGDAASAGLRLDA